MPNNYLQFQLQEQNPPVPPQAAVLAETLACDPVSLAVRRQRVVNGSKRKRDLAAVRMAEELEALERVGEVSAEARRAWEAAVGVLRASLPDSTYRIWIEPLEPAGSERETLTLAAPEPRIANWCERRYSGLILEALIHCSTFNSVSFVSLEGPAMA